MRNIQIVLSLLYLHKSNTSFLITNLIILSYNTTNFKLPRKIEYLIFFDCQYSCVYTLYSINVLC